MNWLVILGRWTVRNPIKERKMMPRAEPGHGEGLAQAEVRFFAPASDAEATWPGGPSGSISWCGLFVDRIGGLPLCARRVAARGLTQAR